MSFQQCRFNFGSEPFRYPPQSRKFDSFNGHAQLKPQDKIVLPRHIFLDQLRKLSVREDSCTLCFDSKGIIRLEPCKHRCVLWGRGPFQSSELNIYKYFLKGDSVKNVLPNCNIVRCVGPKSSSPYKTNWTRPLLAMI